MEGLWEHCGHSTSAIRTVLSQAVCTAITPPAAPSLSMFNPLNFVNASGDLVDHLMTLGAAGLALWGLRGGRTSVG